MGPWCVLFSFQVPDFMQLNKNFYLPNLTNNLYNLCLVLFGPVWGHDLAGRRDSLCWVPEQASGNKNNAGSPFQAWAGWYLLPAFSSSRLIWYTNSEISLLCTRYTL